jgi:hypothetical protein
MRQQWLALLTLSLTLSCATAIKGHEITDNALNREVVALIEAYRAGMEARDADRVLALVASVYFEDNGNADPADDYGKAELKKRLIEDFARTSALHLKIQLMAVISKGDEVAARMRLAVRYRLDLPSGARWETSKDVNEIILLREEGSLRIKSGL